MLRLGLRSRRRTPGSCRPVHARGRSGLKYHQPRQHLVCWPDPGTRQRRRGHLVGLLDLLEQGVCGVRECDGHSQGRMLPFSDPQRKYLVLSWPRVMSVGRSRRRATRGRSLRIRASGGRRGRRAGCRSGRCGRMGVGLDQTWLSIAGGDSGVVGLHRTRRSSTRAACTSGCSQPVLLRVVSAHPFVVRSPSRSFVPVGFDAAAVA